MGSIGKGLDLLFSLVTILFFAGLPICFGLGLFLGWVIWK